MNNRKTVLIFITLVFMVCLAAPVYAQECVSQATGNVYPDPGPFPAICDSTSPYGWSCAFIAADYAGLLSFYNPGEEEYGIAYDAWLDAFPGWVTCMFGNDLTSRRAAIKRVLAIYRLQSFLRK